MIEAYLKRRTITDPFFAGKYGDPKKSIDGCISYILNTVKESKINGYADYEVFSMAVHYYLEDSIEEAKAPN